MKIIRLLRLAKLIKLLQSMNMNHYIYRLQDLLHLSTSTANLLFISCQVHSHLSSPFFPPLHLVSSITLYLHGQPPLHLLSGKVPLPLSLPLPLRSLIPHPSTPSFPHLHLLVFIHLLLPQVIFITHLVTCAWWGLSTVMSDYTWYDNPAMVYDPLRDAPFQVNPRHLTLTLRLMLTLTLMLMLTLALMLMLMLTAFDLLSCCGDGCCCCSRG